jgi:hypothetical protein
MQSLLTAAGDIIYASAANTPARLAKGTNGHVLTLAAGVPSWAAPSTTPADASVSQAKLKTSQGSVSSAGDWANLTLPGGEYGFYPQIKMQDTSSLGYSVSIGSIAASSYTGWTTYTSNVNTRGQGKTVYVRQRYVTSSGEVFWIFILRDKTTKEVVATWQAPDHPCFGNGGKPKLVPHPFPDYDPETQEIIVINPSVEEVAEMRAACGDTDDETPDRDLIQVILEDYDIDEESSPKWTTKKVSVALKNNADWSIGETTEVVKKLIPKPDGVVVRRLKKK